MRQAVAAAEIFVEDENDEGAAAGMRDPARRDVIERYERNM